MRAIGMAVLVTTLTLGASAHARNLNPRVIPPRTAAYSQLAAKWWQWALETPASENPLTDTTGEFGGVNQSGPVWFLAGNPGGETERTVTVPAGKALFFPIVNEFSANGPEDTTTVEELRAALAADIDTATDLACEIDGKPVQNLTNYRTRSVVFSIELPEDNIFGDPSFAGTYAPAVDDGIYLLVAPLRVGAHTIHFHGSLPNFDLTLDITYHLTVAPSE